MIMDGSTTLTIRLDSKVKKQLGRLAASTDRTKSWLAAEAIAAYVGRESGIVADITQALSKVRSDKAKLIPHDKAMATLRNTVDGIARRKR
jgi:predicted transcriptional regulator